MRFTMNTPRGYLVRAPVGGAPVTGGTLDVVHLITMAQAAKVGLKLGDEVELVLSGETVPVVGCVVGHWASVDEGSPA